MAKIHVLLLFGGESPEHEVSISSAKNVYDAIDKQKYITQLCYITSEGIWHAVDSVRKAIASDVTLSAALGEKSFLVGNKKIKPDVILPILHGQNGEDGSVQALAQLLHIPIAGPSLLSAVVAMDKDITKKLLTAADLPVVDWIVIHKTSSYPSYETITKHLGDNLFVKPVGTGSSVGVSKVLSGADYDKAIRLAFSHGEKIIIESAVENAREIEVAIIGNQQPQASIPGEIVPGQEFYSYEDKYDDSSQAAVKVPAELDEATQGTIKRMALRAYKAAEGHGMARIDFFLTQDGKIYLNEINTIPGFTNISMYPKLWRHSGLEYPELIDKLIQLALEK